MKSTDQGVLMSERQAKFKSLYIQKFPNYKALKHPSCLTLINALTNN